MRILAKLGKDGGSEIDVKTSMEIPVIPSTPKSGDKWNGCTCPLVLSAGRCSESIETLLIAGAIMSCAGVTADEIGFWAEVTDEMPLLTSCARTKRQ